MKYTILTHAIIGATTVLARPINLDATSSSEATPSTEEPRVERPGEFPPVMPHKLPETDDCNSTSRDWPRCLYLTTLPPIISNQPAAPESENIDISELAPIVKEDINAGVEAHLQLKYKPFHKGDDISFLNCIFGTDPQIAACLDRGMHQDGKRNGNGVVRVYTGEEGEVLPVTVDEGEVDRDHVLLCRWEETIPECVERRIGSEELEPMLSEREGKWDFDDTHTCFGNETFGKCAERNGLPKECGGKICRSGSWGGRHR